MATPHVPASKPAALTKLVQQRRSGSGRVAKTARADEAPSADAFSEAFAAAAAKRLQLAHLNFQTALWASNGVLPQSSSPSASANGREPWSAVATASRASEGDGTLALRAGEALTVVEQHRDNLWRAALADGRSGLVALEDVEAQPAEASFSALMELVVAGEVQWLDDVAAAMSPQWRTRFLATYLTIFESLGEGINVLRHMVGAVVAGAPRPEAVFGADRVDGVTTLLLEYSVRHAALALHAALAPTWNILVARIDLELDPARAGPDANAALIEKRAERVMTMLVDAVTRLKLACKDEAGSGVPLRVRMLLLYVRTVVERRFPGTGTAALVRFFFGRVLVHTLYAASLMPSALVDTIGEAADVRRHMATMSEALMAVAFDASLEKRAHLVVLGAHRAALRTAMVQCIEAALADVSFTDDASLFGILEQLGSHSAHHDDPEAHKNWRELHLCLSLQRDRVCAGLRPHEADRLRAVLAPMGPPRWVVAAASFSSLASVSDALDTPASPRKGQRGSDVRRVRSFNGSDSSLFRRRSAASLAVASASESTRRRGSARLSPDLLAHSPDLSRRRSGTRDALSLATSSGSSSGGLSGGGGGGGGSSSSGSSSSGGSLIDSSSRRRTSARDTSPALGDDLGSAGDAGDQPDAAALMQRLTAYQLGADKGQLRLNHCSLTHVPDLKALTQLRALDLSHNLISRLPLSIMALSLLEDLDLSHNRLEKLPFYNLLHMPRLARLAVHGNPFPFPFTFMDRLSSDATVPFLRTVNDFVAVVNGVMEAAATPAGPAQQRQRSKALQQALRSVAAPALGEWLAFLAEHHLHGALATPSHVLSHPTQVPVLQQVACTVELHNPTNGRATFALSVAPTPVAMFELKVNGDSLGTEGEVALARGKSATLVVLCTYVATTRLQHPIRVAMTHPRELTLWLLWQGESALSYELDASEVELGKVIGSGATCTVFRSTWRGVAVAAKRIMDTASEARVEAKLLCQLQHPNVVVFYGVARTDESLLLVTELVPLGALSTLLEDRATVLPWALRTRFVFETALALQYLHANNVVHRDVKSNNLLVASLEPSADVAIKLCDFGVARTVGPHMTGSEGTVLWMAPEVLTSKPYGTPADVWSLGIIMGEVASRAQPWAALTYLQAVHAVEEGIVEENMPPDTPALYAELRLRCLQRDPALRHSAADVVHALGGGAASPPHNELVDDVLNSFAVASPRSPTRMVGESPFPSPRSVSASPPRSPTPPPRVTPQPLRHRPTPPPPPHPRRSTVSEEK